EERWRLKGAFSFKFDLSADQEKVLAKFNRDKAKEYFDIARNKRASIQYYLDDPEKMLGDEREGWNALAGLVEAADQINVNYNGVVGMSVLVKTHLYGGLSEYEEIANMFSENIVTFSWTKSDLIAALECRLSEAQVSKAEFMQLTEKQFDEEFVAKLRNGPRDMFNWLALAFIHSGKKQLTLHDLEQTLAKTGKETLKQITTAYTGIVPEIPVILREVFEKREALTNFDLLNTIMDKRANSQTMQSADSQNSLDTNEKYRDFLIESGAISVIKDGNVLNPYQVEFVEAIQTPEKLIYKLHDLISAHLF
ncbi:MAG: hypothetical protein AAFR73_11420, partial [Pseudomonadota bacterium]